MNIFITDYNPKIAAQNLCDVHLNKMIVESAQMISTYIISYGRVSFELKQLIGYTNATKENKEKFKIGTGLCLPTHINHPCNVWLREDIKNVQWLCYHFRMLLLEYNHRKNKVHACYKHYQSFKKYLPFFQDIPSAPPDNFCLCMPDEFKTDDPVQSYRNYYIFKYTSNPRLRKYSGKREPQWLIDAVPSLIEY